MNNFKNQDIGRNVVAKRHASSAAVSAVIVDVSDHGAACIARLNNDGTVRQEKLWTGLWHFVGVGKVDQTTNLLERLQQKYPALDFTHIYKIDTSECDNDRAPERLICFTANGMACVDPFSSDCGRFEVDPKTAYGIDVDDATEMAIFNGVQLNVKES